MDGHLVAAGIVVIWAVVKSAVEPMQSDVLVVGFDRQLVLEAK